jgi:hypothetical protein
MREIWDHPFGYALLKIERANKHIAEIEERIRVSSYDHGPSVHINMQTGEKVLNCAHTDWKLAADLALIVGDAIHNLHSALDIAWVEIVRKLSPKGPSKYTRFPADPEGTREKLESTLVKSAEIPRSNAVCDLMLDRIKPYKGGDADLLLLNSFDINDKHQLLIPLVTVAGVRGIELEHEDGRVEILDIILTRRQGFSQTIPLETKLKNHGQTAFQVTFRETTTLNDSEVIPTLKRFASKVTQIVRVLQRVK